jgi:hypothetical protein
MPWSVLKNEPKIQLIEHDDKFFKLKITLYSFDETYFQPMVKRVELFAEQNL